MSEEIAQIDTTPIDALVRIQKDEKGLRDLIEKALASKDKVSEAVYRKVVRDYEGRLAGLDAEARPLREQARGEFRKLAALHDRLKAALEKVRLEQQEIAFRHEIGELSEEDFARQREGAEAAVAACQREFDQADALRQRFLEVLPAVPEPEPAQPPPAPPPVPARSPAPVAEDDSPPTLRGKAGPPPAPPAPQGGGGETLYIESPARAEEPSPEFGTVVVSVARLVEDREGSEGESYPLGPSTTIGRTRDCQIAIETLEVSRRHARIALTESGYVLTDLNSGNGSFVNGQRISESRIQDGDRIQIGNAFFVFRTG
jgi:hypothetical protein